VSKSASAQFEAPVRLNFVPCPELAEGKKNRSMNARNVVPTSPHRRVRLIAVPPDLPASVRCRVVDWRCPASSSVELHSLDARVPGWLLPLANQINLLRTRSMTHVKRANASVELGFQNARFYAQKGISSSVISDSGAGSGADEAAEAEEGEVAGAGRSGVARSSLAAA